MYSILAIWSEKLVVRDKRERFCIVRDSFSTSGFCWLVGCFVGRKLGDKYHVEIQYNFYVRAFQNVFFSIWNVEINKSSNFAHVTRLPSKHIRDTEKEYSRSFACNVLHAHHVFIPRYLYVVPHHWYSSRKRERFCIVRDSFSTSGFCCVGWLLGWSQVRR